MPLRQARKIVKQRLALDLWAPGRPRDQKAIRRYLRWPGRRLAHHNLDSFIGHYTLDNLGRPQLFTGDMLDWNLIHSIEHRVEWTALADGTLISTIFLGMDHNFGDMLHMRGGRKAPVLFETMVQLPGEKWDEQHRYTTLHDARVGHALLVERLSSHGQPVPALHPDIDRLGVEPRVQKLHVRAAVRWYREQRRRGVLKANAAIRTGG